MKILILLKDDEAKTYHIEDIDPLGDSKYQFQRRIEKEGWRADRAFIVDEKDILPISEWEDEFYSNQAKWEYEEKEIKEKSEYERLKRKFEK